MTTKTGLGGGRDRKSKWMLHNEQVAICTGQVVFIGQCYAGFLQLRWKTQMGVPTKSYRVLVSDSHYEDKEGT